MTDLAVLIEGALADRHPRLRGDELDFCCVAHDEQNPSASWSRKKGAWHCLACGVGGSSRDLAERLGIPVETPRQRAQRAEIVATYDYTDEEGKLLYQVVRMRPKDFRQRRPDGHGGWHWNLEGVRLVPYRLPSLLESTGRCYIVEGEKDVETLVQRGLVATCNSGGAGKWRSAYDEHFRDREVILLPDHDAPGEKHAADVAARLARVARSVRILRLPDLEAKGDVSDWLAQGGSAEELELLATDCPLWTGDQGGGLTEFALTDSGNAELFAHLYGDRVRYDWGRGRWLYWDQHRWITDPNGELYRLAKQAVRARFRGAAELESPEQRAAIAKFSIGSESANRLESMLKLARSEEPLADSGESWDIHPGLLGCANGIVELSSGRFRPGKAEDRVTMSTGIAYDAAAACPRWLRFLDEIFEGDAELVAFVQRACGYSLTGITREQVWFLCHGSGSNGKSTFLDTLQLVLGEYSGDTPADTLCARGGLNSGGASPDLAALQGKRLVTCSETEELAKVNAARLKWLTGGNPITARFLHQNFVTFTPLCKLWLTTNHLPRVDDDSEGFWRRVRLIPFLRHFEAEDRDLALAETLRGELPGILRWAVAGAVQWQQSGLNPPLKVVMATANYRMSADPLAEFISDCCVVGANYRATRAELFGAYVAWGKEQGYPEKDLLGSRSFGRRVAERWPNEKSGSVRRYRGIGLIGLNQGHNEGGRDIVESGDRENGIVPKNAASRGENTRTDVPYVPSVPEEGTCGCEVQCRSRAACQDEYWWGDDKGRWHCERHHPDNSSQREER